MKTKRNIFVGLALSFITLISGQIIFGTPVFAVTNPTLTINLGSLSSLDLMPGSFGSTSQSVGITTNNYTGYTVSLTNAISSTDLVNSNDNTLVIPTITLPSGSTSITENDFDSGYGVSIDGTNYLPAPTPSNDILIGSSNAAGTGSHTLTFGAKPATGTVAGSYSKTFIITAIVNHPQYSITYDANAGTDTVTGMPSNQGTTTSTTGTVTLPNDVPVRSGYTFLGWDESSTATTPTYATGNTNTIALEPTQANTITLYAVWGHGGSGTPDDPYIDNTTTVYDPSNQEPGTTVRYEAIDGQPQVTVDNNGNVTSFEFIDLGSTGINIAGFDTELVAFDGSSSFTLKIKFTEQLSLDTSYDKVVSVIQDTGSGNNHNYSGFTLFYYYRSSGGGGNSAKYLRTQSFVNKSSLQGQTMSSGNNLAKVDTTVTSYVNSVTTYEFEINYNQSNRQVTVISKINNGTATTQTFTSNITSALTNATVVIGSNGLDTTEDMSSTFKVLEFSVSKN